MLDFNKFQVTYDEVKEKPYLKVVSETIALYQRILDELSKPAEELERAKIAYDDFLKNSVWYEDMPIMKTVDKILDANIIMLKYLLDQNEVLKKGFSDLYEYLDMVHEQGAPEEEAGSLVEIEEQVVKPKIVSTLPEGWR